ncbi:hypothetical protein C5U48_09390 [Mycolicibacter virginiensis]|uniref:Uncharacterized protein n=1 Tax=Mycolicibacter virginiensis TaxID=1795032 RepID=A0A9X7NYZ1_9MYCO|nr:hypothetical protein [Mycolicibacter virginiensis]PQM52507.1 hypothetical protein C5U48_09390 [Mycolicibacter virginiensis]
MSTIDPKRPQRLIDKYGIDRPPNPDNPIVAAILDAERITERVHGRDNGALFDPVWCPAMWERANAAMGELRTRLGLPHDDPNRVRLDSDDYADADCAELPADAVVLWGVGAGAAQIARASAPFTCATRRVDRFTWAVQLAQEIDDYWCHGDDNPRYIADYELRCNVNIANDCTAPLSPDVNDFGGGTTRLMLLRRGQFILLFRCCQECERLAGQLSDTNYQIAVIEAHERLADMPDPAWVRTAPRWMRWRAAIRRRLRRRR